MFNKIADVKPLSNYILYITFQNGDTKYYDVKQLFDVFPDFKTLTTTTGLFEQVKVDTGGYGIIWNDEIDLSCNELYDNSTPN